MPPTSRKIWHKLKACIGVAGLGLSLSGVAFAKLSCVAISGLGQDQTGAFQRVYPYFLGPQVAGGEDFSAEELGLAPAVTGVLYLGSSPCLVFASWKDAHAYLREQAALEDAPAEVPEQVVILHLAHGLRGGGIICDAEESYVSPSTIMEYLYDLAAFYQVALLDDACYGSDLQIAKLRYEIAQGSTQNLYPRGGRDLYKMGRVCLLTSSPVGLFTRGTPLTYHLCHACAHFSQTDNAAAVRPQMIDLSPILWNGTDRFGEADFKKFLEGLGKNDSFLKGHNLLALLKNEPQLFWSGLDFDRLGVADSLYYTMLPPSVDPAAQFWADDNFYRQITLRLAYLARNLVTVKLQENYAALAPHHRMRFVYEQALAPYWYWILAFRFGQDVDGWTEVLRLYHGGWLWKEEALAWLDKHPVEFGLAEIEHAIKWWRSYFPAADFKDLTSMEAAFQQGRGIAQWYGFPRDLAAAAVAAEDLANAPYFDLAKLQACLRQAKSALRAQLEAMPPASVVTEEYLAQAFEENFYQGPGRASDPAQVVNCFPIRASWGLSFFRTQWEMVFPEMLDDLRTIIDGHRPANYAQMQDLLAELARPGVVAEQLLAITKDLPAPAPENFLHDLNWQKWNKFIQRVRDHVLGLVEGPGASGEDADPLTHYNFEPFGQILPMLAQQHLINYFPDYESFKSAPGSELDRLRAQACLNFGALWPVLKVEQVMTMSAATPTASPPPKYKFKIYSPFWKPMAPLRRHKLFKKDQP